MNIAIGQINTTIGDFVGNLSKMLNFAERAEQRGAQLVVFPEQAITGYPPKDFLESRKFIDRNLEALQSLANRVRNIDVIVGFVSRNEEEHGKPLYNSAALLSEGKVQFLHHKLLLPSYDIFDETRYFEPGKETKIFEWKGYKLGILICEDIWADSADPSRRIYQRDPIDELEQLDCNLVVHINASPYWQGKRQVRHSLLEQLSQRLKAPVVHCNLIGGNDEVIFDGESCIYSADGKRIAQAARFREDLLICDLKENTKRSVRLPKTNDLREIVSALELGLVDYFTKCRFRKAVIGLSGGIDSALAATLTTRALGAKNVLGIIMPSRYNSEATMNDAKLLAERLGIQHRTIPIDPLVQDMNAALAPSFDGTEPDITEENIQARIRGNLLMAFSNKFHALLINTGNKSEMAVGYCTLYGDLAGGLAVLADIPKTLVYRLAHYLNEKEEIIPPTILHRPPSAELRDNQKDEDNLPPYDLLDAILKGYIEERKDLQDLIQEGYPAGTVRQVLTMVDRNEYKRRQAPVTLKVTARAFGTGRRLPIAQRWR